MVLDMLVTAAVLTGCLFIVSKTPRMINPVKKRRQKLIEDLRVYGQLKNRVESVDETSAHKRDFKKLEKSIIKKSKFIARHRGANSALSKEALKKLYKKGSERKPAIEVLAKQFGAVSGASASKYSSSAAKKALRNDAKDIPDVPIKATIEWGQVNQEVGSAIKGGVYIDITDKLLEIKDKIATDSSYTDKTGVLKDPIVIETSYLKKKSEDSTRTIRNMADLDAVIDDYLDVKIEEESFEDDPVGYLDVWEKFKGVDLLEYLGAEVDKQLKNLASADKKLIFKSTEYKKLQEIKKALVRDGYSFTARKKLNRNDPVLKADVANVKNSVTHYLEGNKVRTIEVKFSAGQLGSSSKLTKITGKSYNIWEAKHDFLKNLLGAIKGDVSEERFPYKYVEDLPTGKTEKQTIGDVAAEEKLCKQLLSELKASPYYEYSDKDSDISKNVHVIKVTFPNTIDDNVLNDICFSEKRKKEIVYNKIKEVIATGKNRFPYSIKVSGKKEIIASSTDEDAYIKNNLDNTYTTSTSPTPTPAPSGSLSETLYNNMVFGLHRYGFIIKQGVSTVQQSYNNMIELARGFKNELIKLNAGSADKIEYVVNNGKSASKEYVSGMIGSETEKSILMSNVDAIISSPFSGLPHNL